MRAHDSPTVEIDVDGRRVTVGALHVRIARLLALFRSPLALAAYVGVAPERVDEWLQGDTPTGSTAALLTDLSFVWERATDDQADDAVQVWLFSSNRFLRVQPLEAIRQGRLGDVIAAWDAYLEGGYP